MVSDTLALLYPQLNRIEEEAILARGMDPHGRADFGVKLVEEIPDQDKKNPKLTGRRLFREIGTVGYLGCYAQAS